jgi:phospholipase D1/2
VIVDADAGNGKRKVVAFVGGLDLCGGRYDTPSHPLFRTLQTLHKDDYYNPNYAVRTPRSLVVEQYLNFIRDSHVLVLHLVYQCATSMQVTDDRGPREPWHDLHSKVDGPAAYDILTNFEERWLRALKMTRLQKMKTSHDDSLLKIDRISDIVGIDEVSSLDEPNQETWHVQVSLIDRILIPFEKLL